MVKTLYVDTSAFVRAHLPDEPEHRELANLLFAGEHDVLTSDLTRVEFASALASARDAGRVRHEGPALARFDEDTDSGVVSMVPLAPHRILPVARRLVLDHPALRALDAIHLAVALNDVPKLIGEPPTMVTRDRRQAEAAKANGLEVR